MNARVAELKLCKLLMLLGRRTGREFAKQAEHSGGGFLIGEVFERHCGREVRRDGVEADADKILVAPADQRIHHRRDFYGPVILGGLNHSPGARYLPVSIMVRSIRLHGTRPPVLRTLVLRFTTEVRTT